jgi:hypothetical protein
LLGRLRRPSFKASIVRWGAQESNQKLNQTAKFRRPPKRAKAETLPILRSVRLRLSSSRRRMGLPYPEARAMTLLLSWSPVCDGGDIAVFDRSFLTLALSNGVPRRSVIVALVVGTILNVINQGDVLFLGGELNVLKLALTYCVPYCVATYGAVTFAKAQMYPRGEQA